MKLSLADARRMAVAGQLLPTRGTSILEVVRRIGYLQLDPTRAVERNHLLVLWSRLGSYSVEELRRLLDERELYEYSAAIVPTGDFPLHRSAMRRFPAYGPPDWNRSIRTWLKDNATAQRQIIAQLRRNGHLASRDLAVGAMRPWESTGWTNDRNLTRLLEFLSLQGKVLVSKRQGNQRLWDVAERVVPERLRKSKSPPLPEVVRRAADRSLRGLGVATPREVRDEPFVGGPYPGIEKAAQQIGRVAEVEGLRTRLVHPAAEPWRSRKTTLLSPFDPLIRNRERTHALFGFRFRLEIYVPKDKREFGFFVLPILHGDRLIGRVDPTMDRTANVFRVNAVYAEEAAPEGAGPAIARAIERLGEWLGADEIAYSRKVPPAWRDSLRN
ncbi:MAG: crosslink repair DNA glycosylase YcaQ family protein [Actinomycetota bacterium]